MSDEQKYSLLDTAFAEFLTQRTSFNKSQKALFNSVIAELSYQQSQGHSCIHINQAEQALIQSSTLASDPCVSPLVLEKNRLYLQRYWFYENRLAQQIKAFLQVKHAVNDVNPLLNRYFIELIDEISIRAINQYSKLDYPEKPHLFMEFHGSKNSVSHQTESILNIAKDFKVGDFKWSTKTEELSKLWSARHQAYYATKALFPNQIGMSTDICVPISKLAKAIKDTQNDLKKFNVTGSIIGHVGDGNYHTLLFSDPKNPEDLKLNKYLANRMAERALDVGGTVTGEHGIGIGKLDLMEQEHGEALSVMKDLKKLFDPKNIMNPGKMISLDTNKIDN